MTPTNSNFIFNKGNFKTFLTVIPAVGMTDGQKSVIGGVSENLEGIVAQSFDHTTPEFASLIAQKAIELNQLCGYAYAGSAWTPGKQY